MNKRQAKKIRKNMIKNGYIIYQSNELNGGRKTYLKFNGLIFTGMNVDDCMFAICFPKNLPLDQFNYSSGQHELVETTIEFTATKYESTQIKQIAKCLIDKYKVLTNSPNVEEMEIKP